MKRFTLILGIALLAAVALPLCSPRANAGRIGGPLAGRRTTIPGNQFVTYDVSFFAGVPAIVDVAGNGRTNLDLYVYDGDGNVSIGTGFADHKRVVMTVYRAGTFRIEVVNRGPLANSILLSTN